MKLENFNTPALTSKLGMSPMEALRWWKTHFFTTRGRLTRSGYWWMVLWNIIISMVLLFVSSILNQVLGASNEVNIGTLLFNIVSIVFGISMICAQVRRLHDIGKSGLWWLLSLIPIVSLILIFWNVRASSPKDNEYGPAPTH